MKKNNKGFMLAEVVVTATLLLTIMVSLFFAFNRIYTRYNSITAYKNIDGMFAIENMLEYMLNETGENNLNNILLQKENSNYKFIIENQNCKLTDNNYCNKIKEAYHINNFVIVKQIHAKELDKDDKKCENNMDKINNDPISSLKCKVANNTFKDYIDYLKKYYPLYDNNQNINNYVKNSYLIIIEYKAKNETNENNYQYSSLELR